jgi:hypothetical protein
LRVSVAVKVTGPDDPNGTELGLTLFSTNVVGTVAFTVSDCVADAMVVPGADAVTMGEPPLLSLYRKLAVLPLLRIVTPVMGARLHVVSVDWKNCPPPELLPRLTGRFAKGFVPAFAAF